MFKSYSNDFLCDSGFPAGLNGRKYRFFGVGDTLGDILGDTFGGLQKRNVLKGDTFGDTKCVYIRVDSPIYMTCIS